MCFGQLLLSRRESAAVGEQLAAGLAARAVVGLVVGVDDALHRRAAVGAGLAEAAVHRHRRMERGHLLGPVAGFARSRAVHSASVDLPPREEALDRRRVERARQRERREPGAVQDLVGVGVADAAEEARIGERALERVVLGDEARRERRASVAAITSMPPASSAASAARPATTCSDARRCLPASVRASVPLSNSKKASALRAGLLAGREPAQPAGDHQVDDEEELALEREDDALAEPLDADDNLAFDRGNRRRHRAQQERMADADALETVADDLGRQALEVDADVGQLGHRPSVPSARRRRRRPPSARDRRLDRRDRRRRRVPADDRALRRDHRQRRRLELGEVALGAVLDQQAVVAAVVGLAHRGLHADLGRHAGEDEVRDAARLQDLVQAGGPEHALAGLVDDDLAGFGASAGMISAPGSPPISTRPIGPGSPMRSVGVPRSAWRAGSRTGRAGAPRACARSASRARATRRAAPRSARSPLCSRVTSLPSEAPKPPGSMKSRCMSMTTSAVLPAEVYSNGVRRRETWSCRLRHASAAAPAVA